MNNLPFELSRNPNLDKLLEEINSRNITIQVRVEDLFLEEDILYIIISVNGEPYDIKINLRK